MTDGNRTFLKWSVLPCFFLTKKQFYYRNIFVIACHLNCILWMKDNVRQVVSTFLNAVFKPLLKIGVYSFQHLTINCCHFLPDCLLQIGQGARFVSTVTRFEVSPQKKVTSGQIRGPWGPLVQCITSRQRLTHVRGMQRIWTDQATIFCY